MLTSGKTRKLATLSTKKSANSFTSHVLINSIFDTSNKPRSVSHAFGMTRRARKESRDERVTFFRTPKIVCCIQQNVLCPD